MVDSTATYVLVPGAGGGAWYWSRVQPLLERRGHEVIAIDLPADDDSAGLPEYVDIIVAAIGERQNVTLVAQSLGGFTTPLVAQRTALRAIVTVNAMIPAPGEAAGQWWGNVGSAAASLEAARAGGYSTEFDLETYFFHDVDPAIMAEAAQYARDESDAVFEAPCKFERWPDVPTSVLVGADDRLFPAEFQRRVARERLGIEAEVLPGGHLMALSQPERLATRLLQL